MSRDPNRIPAVLEALREFWERNPDFRLGQLAMAATKTGEHAPKLFQMEDDEFLRRLSQLSLALEGKL